MTPVLPVQELEARSLRKMLFLRWERDVWDQLRQQKDLLSNANKLLSTRSTEAEDFRLCCADMKAEATTAREQAIPLVARIKELEEELTRVAGERDTFRSRTCCKRCLGRGPQGGRGLPGRGLSLEGKGQG